MGLFGWFDKHDKAKVVYKTKKGRGPVEKVKVQLTIPLILAGYAALGVLEFIPKEFHNLLAEGSMFAVSLIQVTLSYLKRPGPNDGAVVDPKGL